MISFKKFFVIFTAISLLEILLFVEVGERIGAAWTIVCVVATAVIGANAIRFQGFSTLRKIQNQLNEGQLPGKELLEGALLMVSGALLLTPGFLTDAIGFALLIPALRGPLAANLIQRGMLQVLNQGGTVFYGSSYSENRSPFGNGADFEEIRRQVEQNFGSNTEGGDVIEGEYERKDPENPAKTNGNDRDS